MIDTKLFVAIIRTVTRSWFTPILLSNWFDALEACHSFFMTDFTHWADEIKKRSSHLLKSKDTWTINFATYFNRIVANRFVFQQLDIQNNPFLVCSAPQNRRTATCLKRPVTCSPWSCLTSITKLVIGINNESKLTSSSIQC